VTLQVSLFDHLQVALDGVSRTTALRPRAQRLLAYLLLHRGHPLPRESVAFTLWPDSPENESLGTLRRALSDLRAALQTGEGGEWLIAARGEVGWMPGAPYWLDVEEFERFIHRSTPASLHDAVALYSGDLLSNLDDDWVLIERERLRGMQLSTLHRLTTHHRSLGEYAAALGLARRALALDPLAEAIHRELIALPYLAGDRAAALAEFDRLRALLRDELGAEPMAETRALADAISRGESLPVFEAPEQRAAFTIPSAQPLPRLIGRETEMTRFGALWESAAAGHGRLAIVSGEAGVGKSHLALGLAEYVTRRGGLVFVGRCYEFEAALPYQAIIGMLRPAANMVRQADLPPPYRSALARLAPDIMGAAGGPAEAAPGDSREQLFEALLQAFLVLARSQPLLLLVEDAHWAAESTLDWLTYIAPRLSASRLLVVITYRTNEVGAQHTLARLERRFAREGAVSAQRLEPLSREANRELVGALSGLTQARAEPVADQLFVETAGNPFFLHELVRGLIEAGQIEVIQEQWAGAFVEAAPAEATARALPAPRARSGVPLPASLRATITARVERLTQMAQMFIRTAAVAGQVFDYETVRRAGDWPEEMALSALENLVARGFVREGESEGVFAFAHHLVQDAIQSDLKAPRQVYLHRRLAQAMEAVHPDAFGSLAYHWGAAGDTLKEKHYAILAGDQAAACYANDEAIRYLERALALAMDVSQQTRLLLRIGEVWQLTSHWPQAEAVYRRALGLAETLEDQNARAKCQAALGRLARIQGQYAEALTWLEPARAAYALAGDQQGLSEVMGALGAVYWCQLNYAPALECFEEQLRLAQALNDRRRIGLALGSMGVVYTEQRSYRRALASYELRLQIDLEFGDRLSLAKTVGNIGTVYQAQGDYERALICYARLLQVTLDSGDRQSAAIAMGNMIRLFIGLGRYQAAELASRQALTLGQVLNIPLYFCEYLHDTAELYMLQARYAEAQVVNDEALSIATRIERGDTRFSAEVTAVRLKAALEEVDVPTAIRELEQMRAGRSDPRETAALDYTIWQLDPDRHANRQSAADSYQRLYTETPDGEYRQRYETLTGDSLPAPAPLPELPDWVRQSPVDVEALLLQVGKMVAASRSATTRPTPPSPA
jgi:DNA-binding SARP family transcriptional activator